MRAIFLVIDSFGIGALPDAEQYGDTGANTALSICNEISEVRWPNLKRLGLGNCAQVLGYTLPGCEPVAQPLADFGVMIEASPGKDTTTGHWELAGIVLDKPFHTFPPDFPSFPKQLIKAFEEKSGYQTLGNKAASGTKIIEELGERHLHSKSVIVYTSADSVFQVAAHQQQLAIDELYRVCEIGRELCNDYQVGRVIARPFAGVPGSFERTSQRKDYSMEPAVPTIMDRLQEAGVETVGIGKIGDIFAEKGLSQSHHDHGNEACLERLISCLQTTSAHDQFFFVNLVDTDMLYGHRRDIQGYHDAVARIDTKLPELMEFLRDDDLLIISADHGCDPGFKGTDHTREYAPLLCWTGGSAGGESVGIRGSFSDAAQSVASFFKIPPIDCGVSFIQDNRSNH
ncbi:MAG: phosphopentomutase [Desulfobulbaceae bacterium]|nr:MAG: phosphopentomutase [Desulfobulbaceae bacterium]